MSSDQALKSDETSAKSQDISNKVLNASVSDIVDFKTNVPSKNTECYQCSKTFPTFADAVMHLKLIHNACAFKDCSKLSNFKLHSSVCANRGLGCAICNRKFQEKHLLLMHFYEHIDAALYACEVCREGFQQRKDLQKHFFQIHHKFLSIPVTPSLNKTVYQKCQNCSKYFKLFAEYEEHVSSCSSSTYACCICKVSFSSIAMLEEHKLVEHNNDEVLKGNKALKHGKRYFCGLCFLGFFKGGVLKEHVMTHKTETRHICDVCHITFGSDGDLQAHYLQHIEEHYVLYDVISQHSCKHCKKTFKTLKELNDHMIYKNCKSSSKNLKKFSARNNNDECLTSDKENTVDSNAPLAIPDIPVYVLKVGEDLLNCDDNECVIVMDLTSYYVLQQGMCASESRMPDVKNSEVYTESEYPESSSIENYMYYILSSQNVSAAKPPDDISLEKNNATENVETIVLNINKNDGSMQCEFVGDDAEKVGEFEFLVYDNSVDLSNDSNKVIIHENKMAFDIEDYIHSQDNINKELLIENEDALDVSGLYICNICKQVFSSKTSLCLHMKGSHTGYDCYRCGDSFISEEELKVHEKIHLNAFQCDMCEVSYPKESLLKNHKESAHSKASFMCNTCTKVFATKNELDVHMLLHKGETPPTQCEECGRIYANYSSFLKHKATHVNQNTSKNFLCTICDKVFFEENPLRVHLSTHMRKSPYNFECPKCKMFFPSKMLAKHVQTHVTTVST